MASVICSMSAEDFIRMIAMALGPAEIVKSEVLIGGWFWVRQWALKDLERGPWSVGFEILRSGLCK